MPVKLPPGRAQLSASFASTGSPLKPNTTGFAAFACSMPIAMNSCVTSPEGAEFQVAAFDPAEFAQARAQRFKIRRRLARLPYAQPRNIANAIWLLLRTPHHRPRHGRASEHGASSSFLTALPSNPGASQRPAQTYRP